MADNSDITVVLTSCGRFDLLRTSVASFFEHNTAPIARFLVVEDSGDDAVRAAVDGYPVDVMVNRPRLGQIASIDKAYATVTTPLVFHCEDDWKFFRSGFMEESRLLLTQDPSVSVVCCRTLANNAVAEEIGALPPRQIAGIVHRRPPAWLYRLWHGYTFNPGLRRMSDYRRIGSFAKWGHESDASLFFKRKGMSIVYLAQPACETTGSERRLPKQWPARSLASRLQRGWSMARFVAANLSHPDRILHDLRTQKF